MHGYAQLYVGAGDINSGQIFLPIELFPPALFDSFSVTVHILEYLDIFFTYPLLFISPQLCLEDLFKDLILILFPLKREY